MDCVVVEVVLLFVFVVDVDCVLYVCECYVVE